MHKEWTNVKSTVEREFDNRLETNYITNNIKKKKKLSSFMFAIFT